MILLDTNVVSEFMASPPAMPVQNWLNEQNTANLYFSAVSIAEVCFGLGVMPDGRRRRLLNERFEEFLASAFEGRILPFDEAAARAYGDIRAARKAAGRPISGFDGQIAAIARTQGMVLATRNVKDFEGCGLELIDPFAHTA